MSTPINFADYLQQCALEIDRYRGLIADTIAVRTGNQKRESERNLKRQQRSWSIESFEQAQADKEWDAANPLKVVDEFIPPSESSGVICAMVARGDPMYTLRLMEMDYITVWRLRYLQIAGHTDRAI